MPSDTALSLSVSTIVPHEALTAMAIPLVGKSPIVIKSGYALLRQGLTGLPFHIVLEAVCPCGNECAEDSCQIMNVFFEQGHPQYNGKIGVALQCSRTYRDAEFKYPHLPQHLPSVKLENLVFERGVPHEFAMSALTSPSFTKESVKRIRACCYFFGSSSVMPSFEGSQIPSFRFQSPAVQVNQAMNAVMMPSAKPKSLNELLKELDEQA